MLLNLGEKETSFETKVGMAMMPSIVAFLTVGIFMKTRQSSNVETSAAAGAAALVTYLLTNTRKGEMIE
jgi:hypothetical protein